ncbi:hypothetical protein DRW03_27425 [Corallococcus sp. H22C18031201]|nr:hypothetical protein DRW03_27425 [Corallococcus sp. H22C18031201]
MRLSLIAPLVLFLSAACDDSESSVRSSSLAACSFDDACSDPGERCNVSQECMPYGLDGGGWNPGCQKEEGDRRCHRRCDDGVCAKGETCQWALLSPRSDYADQIKLCLE